MLIGRMTLAVAGAAAVAGMTALSAPAFAQGSLQDQLALCGRIAKKSARIECYDAMSTGPQGTYAPSPSSSGFGASSIRTPSAPPPPPPPGPSATAGAGFGGEQIAAAAPRRNDNAANEIDIAVVSSRDNGLAMWQFSLADGAVWRMTERESSFRPPAPNETVTIRKGALGGYLMDVGRQASVRVERVR